MLNILAVLARVVVACYVIYLGCFKANPTMHDVAFIGALCYLSIPSESGKKCC